MNQISIMGNIGIDPELTHTKTGTPTCKFTVASNHRRGDTEETVWFSCHVYGDHAANFVKIVKKGALVAVIGRAFISQFERDGVSKERVHINVSKWQHFGFREKRENTHAAPQKRASFSPPDDDFDDDMPF